MVRNGTAISINLHTGPQKTVPDTVSRRVHPFRTHGFKTRTKQLRALRIPDRLHKDFAVKRMNAHTFTDKFRKRAFPSTSIRQTSLRRIPDRAASTSSTKLFAAVSPHPQPAPSSDGS